LFLIPGTIALVFGLTGAVALKLAVPAVLLMMRCQLSES
jgi:hypothetical protein